MSASAWRRAPLTDTGWLPSPSILCRDVRSDGWSGRLFPGVSESRKHLREAPKFLVQELGHMATIKPNHPVINHQPGFDSEAHGEAVDSSWEGRLGLVVAEIQNITNA